MYAYTNNIYDPEPGNIYSVNSEVHASYLRHRYVCHRLVALGIVR